MEAYAHGLNQGAVTQGYAGRGYDFLPGQDYVVTHGTVTLHAKCLIELAGIGMA